MPFSIQLRGLHSGTKIIIVIKSTSENGFHKIHTYLIIVNKQGYYSLTVLLN